MLVDRLYRRCEVAMMAAAVAGAEDVPDPEEWKTRFDEYLNEPPLQVSDPEKWELMTALGMKVA